MKAGVCQEGDLILPELPMSHLNVTHVTSIESFLKVWFQQMLTHLHKSRCATMT